MGITTNLFFIFILILFVVYYAIPLKHRWVVLLVASYAYFVYASTGAVIFLIFSALITFFGASKIGKINEEEEDRAKARSRSKGILLLVMLLNFAVLAVLKYTGFVVLNINEIFGSNMSVPQIILPLGISYYTFQSVGYILDVYWNRIEAEKNVAKFALFVSFFPQLIQGPIGRYNTLGVQLREGHRFEYDNLKYGIMRIVWGLFKKMVIADWASVFREAIFNDPDNFKGIAIFGVLLYSAELYANFSGGIDVVLGVARIFGIKMDENFKQPYFSVSITNFWQRWHITLGSWMKDYVFYPLTSAGWMKKLGKRAKKTFGKKTGRVIPLSIANIIVFLIVGIWHGADWGNIGWGLYNGVIIAISTLLGGAYDTWKEKLKVNDKSNGWKVFMILRTFALINISWYFDCADSFSKAFKMIGYSVTNFAPAEFLKIPAGNAGTAYTPYALITLGAAVVLLLIFSIFKEKGIEPYDRMSKMTPVLQYVVIILLFICIPLFAPAAEARGFLYAQF